LPAADSLNNDDLQNSHDAILGGQTVGEVNTTEEDQKVEVKIEGEPMQEVGQPMQSEGENVSDEKIKADEAKEEADSEAVMNTQGSENLTNTEKESIME